MRKNNVLLKAICIFVAILFLSTTVSAMNTSTLLSTFKRINGTAGIQGYPISGEFSGYCFSKYIHGIVKIFVYSFLICAIMHNGIIEGNVYFQNYYSSIKGTYNISNNQITMKGLCYIFNCWASANIV